MSGTAQNPVVRENALPGAPPDEWDIAGAGDPTIQGFASDISVNVGATIDFKIKTDATAYTIDIYRLGWYGGNGARKVTSLPPPAVLPQVQPAPITDPATQIFDCGNWHVSASWSVPTTATSGVYIVLLTRTDTGGASHIPFVVRDDASTSDLFFQTSDTTWQAYNDYPGAPGSRYNIGYPGPPVGASFYVGTGLVDAGQPRAFKLSYNRPFKTRADNDGRDFLFSNEYPMIRFLERNGYDVSYTTGLDSDRRGALIKNHKVFIATGHDEYWSGAQRANVEAARDAGVNLAFFSGNDVYWKTRWEPSVDLSATPARTLVCYKETWANRKIDPSGEWTGTWRDPRFSPPANGGRPENGLIGTLYMSNFDDLPIQVPTEHGRYRIWRNTDLASLPPGTTATLAPHTVGYESNEDLDNGFRPAGLIRLSATTGPTAQYLRDFGNVVTPGTTTHHLTMYRAPSGALVFSAGTIQWAWGLDDVHDGVRSPADPRMQQAMVNLFADMGVQPSTLLAGLTPATRTTDNQPPTVTITSPAAGTTVANGSRVTVAGTAVDVGGGQVAGVEVSTDGATWHPATGTSSWSYTFVACGLDQITVRVRAIDDSANVGANSSVTVKLTGLCSILGDTVPDAPFVDDADAVEVGVKFMPMSDGYILGVRFYKGAGNTGTHTGSLWSADGTRLAAGVFTGETAAGWQTLLFSAPVPVTRNTRYVASYFAPNGHYAADPLSFSYFDRRGVALSVSRSLGADGNGVFVYGGGFPTHSFSDTNYHVDVVFLDSDAATPSVVRVAPPAGALNVAPASHLSVLFSKPLDPTSVQFMLTDTTGAAVNGSVSYDGPSRTVTFTPATRLTASRTYTATVQARDTHGNPTDGPFSWSFTTDQYASILTLFASDAVPAGTATDDPNPVEVGVRFVPAVPGELVGVRFHRDLANTGSHTGSLWLADGTLLAQVTLPDGAEPGWQEARFATPVSVIAGTMYVVSYHAPNGRYSVTGNFFTADWTNGPLRAPATGNGVFRYGTDSGFPTSTFNATNYWVDPLFAPLPADVGPQRKTAIGTTSGKLWS
jgi:N,N-dimethylformamidase beta subunit-like, C-terminal/Domain of unknown function (DUF4082)/Bacterial Ig-like domain/Bacterial Ig domain